ncbi:hypothetical protein CJF25_00140 [Photobacterium phosphoreum]|uniref:hypothetical protein n=1 Tax=Photobacterium phosphoreum TaxID=659 RepID=UPI001E2FBD43|nr:hypothetical protein [Photobacterium phosphoreum]MCD9461426.1 hypothetical protein [Photobacterium phosphoreum]MCD9473779.1 hypothetical protein [Photobacterium phosphoreum]MCF2176209.1 hypothetical protein [Photobacterium phosphoreum]
MISSEYVVKKSNDKDLHLIIELGLPESDPTSETGDYRCKFSVLALDIDEYIYGVDAIQSYCIALKRFNFLVNDLISEGGKFYYPGFLDIEVDILATYF